jgi:hypothetical protein
MDLELSATAFPAIFLAEPRDETQLFGAGLGFIVVGRCMLLVRER